MTRPFVFCALFAAALLSEAATPNSALYAEEAMGVTWTEDFERATSQAKKENKPIFLFFTGSDWCPWCKRFDKEIAGTKEFRDLLGNTLIFVKADFPQNIKQSQATREQNEELKKRYSIKGFPTVVLLDSDLKEIGRMGYESGGGKAFAEKVQKKLNSYLANKEKKS
jgi:protein disulfide-isomerase